MNLCIRRCGIPAAQLLAYGLARSYQAPAPRYQALVVHYQALVVHYQALVSRYQALVVRRPQPQHQSETKSDELFFLPPYSPNLNIIERLWKFTKKCVLYGRYDDKPEKFQQAIKDFIRAVNSKHQNEPECLLALNFQILNSENAHFDAA